MKLVWLVMGLFVPLISPSQAQQPNGVTITSLLSTTFTASGRPIVLPQKDVQVAVSKYVVAPGVALAEHEHPYPRFAYVLSGTLRVTNTENRRTYSYKPGDFIVESVDEWHTGQNIGANPVKLLVIDVIEKGHNNTGHVIR